MNQIKGTINKVWIQQPKMNDYICITTEDGHSVQPMNPKPGVAEHLSEGDKVVLTYKETPMHLRSNGKDIGTDEHAWLRTPVDLSGLPKHWTSQFGQLLGHYIQIDGDVEISSTG